MIDVSEKTDQGVDRFDLEPIMLSPVIVKAAKAIYEMHVETHGTSRRVPTGIALDRYTFRGQLLFCEQPILLPHECFVPLQEINQFETEEEP